MRCVLIYCGVGVAGFCKDRPLGDREGGWVSHGLASIGASLRQAGHEVSLIDLRQLGGIEDMKETLRTAEADVFGLSVSSVDFPIAEAVSLMLRLFHPKSRIMVGGIHPTIFPDAYNGLPVDCVVTGEGEVAACLLVNMAERGIPWKARMQGPKPNLDFLPWAARDLFDYSRELSCTFAPDQKTPSVTMLAGRGCAFQCTYCQPAENSVFGHPYRMRSPEDVVSELCELRRKYQFQSVTFWDDTFTFSPKWIDRFCGFWENQHFNASIAACSRADLICRHEGMVERLASIGLDWFVIGFESGSQRILDSLKKGTTVEQNLQAAKICRKYGIKIFATYMYGLPTETREEALATARMIDEIQPEHPSPFFFRPIPGTNIYSDCEDMILPEAKGGSIARTGMYQRSLQGIDYDYLDALMAGHRA